MGKRVDGWVHVCVCLNGLMRVLTLRLGQAYPRLVALTPVWGQEIVC